MVDLPIPTPQNVTSQAPNPMVTASDIARSGGYIATGLDKLAAGIQARGQGEMERGRGVEQEGQGLIEAGAGYQRLGEGQKALGVGLEDAAVPFAEQAGRNSVTRNADGSISAQPSFIMGKAGDAYAAAQQGMMGPQIRSKIDEDLTNIRNQFPGDVAGFKAAADHYLSVNAATYGNNPVGAMAQGYATGVVAQHFNSIADQASRSSFEGGAKAQDARIDWLNNAINGASGDGAGQSKQVSQWMAERSSLLDSKVANPLYQYTPAMRSVDDQLFAQSNQVAGWTGQARAMYQQTGNLSAARDFMEKKLDTMTGLSEIQKIRYMGEVSAHLRGADALRQQQNQQYKDQADTLITEAKAAGDVDPTRFGTMAQTLNSKKLFAKAAEVTTAGIFQGYQPAILGGTAQESTAALNAIKDQASKAIATGPQGAPAGSADRAAYLQRVREIENPSGNPNATSSTGAKGIYQFIPTTWAAYGGGGDITNPADQEKAAGRLTDANQASLQRSLGRAPTPGELYLAHQQGAGGAAQLLANPTARAGDIVGDKAIAVNGGDPNASASAFTNAWKDKFEKGMGAGASAADTDVAPAYNALLRETYAAYNVHASRLWDGMKAAWDKGYSPTPAEAADLRIMAPNVTDPKLRQDIGQRLQVEGGKAAFSQMPVQQQQDHLAALQLVAQQGGADNVQRQVIGALGEQVAHQTALAKDNPVSYGQRYIAKADQEKMAPINALDFSTPQTFVAGLAARQDMKTAAQKLDPAVGDNVITPADKDAIVGQMQHGDPQSVGNMLAGLSAQLKPPEMGALLQDQGVREGIVGMSRSGDPAKMNAAFSFMDHQFKQNALQFDAQFPGQVKELATWQSNLSNMTPDALAAKMTKANDPNEVAARDRLKGVADEALKNVSAASVVSKFNTGVPFTPIGTTAQPPVNTSDQVAASEAMRSDYAHFYREAFASGQTPATADATATTQLKLKYAVSQTNGNRVMAYPPERYYPQVDGSQDWMGKQLDDEVRGAIGRQYGSTADLAALTKTGALPTFGGSAADLAASKEYLAPRALVSDASTEADITAHRPPSYQVVVQNPDGRFDVMSDPTGKPMRFRFDPAPFRADLQAKAEQQRSDILNSPAQAGYGGGL